jgi:ribosome-associated protein
MALAHRAAALALTKKALEVLVLDLTGVSSVCDYFVVCHGDSDTQVKAIADAILDGLREEGANVWHTEGYTGRSWILLDYVDVVVHVFHRETRQFYRLEDLWADAPRATVS